MKSRSIVFGIIILFCISCRIEKRHYMKGYDVLFYHHPKNIHTNNITKITPPKIKPIENNTPVLSIDTLIKKEPKTYYADANKSKHYISKIFPLMKEWKVVLEGDTIKKGESLSKYHHKKENNNSWEILLLGMLSILLIKIIFFIFYRIMAYSCCCVTFILYSNYYFFNNVINKI